MSKWKILKSTAASFLTGTTTYWVRNGDTVSVCVSVSGNDTTHMAETAERKACMVARKVSGTDLFERKVFMASNGHGLQAVSMVDVPWSPRTQEELNRNGVMEAV